MYRRNIEAELYSALADTPVVLLNGARQTGKSTLVQAFAKASSVPYVTLDDATQLAAARSDAQGFLAGTGGFDVDVDAGGGGLVDTEVGLEGLQARLDDLVRGHVLGLGVEEEEIMAGLFEDGGGVGEVVRVALDTAS